MGDGFRGSDPEQLRDLARRLDAAARFVGSTATEVRNRVTGLRWSGPDRTSFQDTTLARLSSTSRSASAALSDAASKLRREADEQERTSDHLGLRTGGSGTEGRPRTSDEVLAAHGKDLDLTRNESSLGFDGHVAWFDFGTEGGAAITRTADPDRPYEVRLTLDGKVGAGLHGKVANAGAGAEGGVEQVYAFRTEEEARAFVDGLKRVVVPSAKEYAWESLQFWDGGVGGDVVHDTVGYLERFQDARIANEVHVGAYGEANLDFGSGAGSVSAKVDLHGGGIYDLDSRQRSVYLEANVAGDMMLNGFAVDGEAALRSELTFDDRNRVTALVITGTGTIGAGVGGSTPSGSPITAKLSGTAGTEGAFKVNVDMTDPASQALAQQYVTAGSEAERSRALQGLFDRSAVIVQTGDISRLKAEVGVDAVVAGAKVSGDSSQYLGDRAWIKEPGSDLYHEYDLAKLR